ncbi:XRE family transcriptional regulator [Pseudomonas sp. A-RE-19]|uniref:XRE family transcriptional regulator n=1 Tax=Pseudomonas sp. A-RE-19 TaxID=2832401 RepID=UPI001CBFE0F9|nr:XRE family transcriptional regulator [Pseudomonas sp. A-RE-19]
MNENDESHCGVDDTTNSADAGELRAKAEYVMKIGLLLEAGQLTRAQAAQRLGLSLEELDEILHGKFRDLTIAKISEYPDLQVGERN